MFCDDVAAAVGLRSASCNKVPPPLRCLKMHFMCRETDLEHADSSDCDHASHGHHQCHHHDHHAGQSHQEQQPSQRDGLHAALQQHAHTHSDSRAGFCLAGHTSEQPQQLQHDAQPPESASAPAPSPVVQPPHARANAVQCTLLAAAQAQPSDILAASHAQL